VVKKDAISTSAWALPVFGVLVMISGVSLAAALRRKRSTRQIAVSVPTDERDLLADQEAAIE